MRFADDFHSWLRHSWKSLANRLTRDPKIVIHGNSCIILYFSLGALSTATLNTVQHIPRCIYIYIYIYIQFAMRYGLEPMFLSATSRITSLAFEVIMYQSNHTIAQCREQMVEQTVELPVIWVAMTFIWRHFNGLHPISRHKPHYPQIVLRPVIAFRNAFYFHDDVIKLKHFPRYWSFVRGIHRSPMDSPHKGKRRGTLKFFISTWTNGWANTRDAGDLRRHRAYHDVTIMLQAYPLNPVHIGQVSAQLCCGHTGPIWTGYIINVTRCTSNFGKWMSCLDSLPGHSTGEFQALQLIVLVVFGAVD